MMPIGGAAGFVAIFAAGAAFAAAFSATGGFVSFAAAGLPGADFGAGALAGRLEVLATGFGADFVRAFAACFVAAWRARAFAFTVFVVFAAGRFRAADFLAVILGLPRDPARRF
jgi:hypothetical protein